MYYPAVPCRVQLDRLQDLTMRDAQEQERRRKRIEDRKAITEQIEARRRDNLVRLEAREQVKSWSASIRCQRGFRREHRPILHRLWRGKIWLQLSCILPPKRVE